MISIIIIIGAGCVLYNSSRDSKGMSSVLGGEVEIEDTQTYSKDIPVEISSSQAWKDFVSSEYYDSEQDYTFKSTDDRIVCETYYSDYYIYMEYVFEELIIDVYNSSDNTLIVRFE